MDWNDCHPQTAPGYDHAHLQNGAARIQDALHRGRQVMAKADKWFRVVSFREEVTADGYRLWYATGEPWLATDLFVTTVTWNE
jgi:hypothetical protein